MSPPTPGFPERFVREPERMLIQDRLATVEERLATVERQTSEIPQVVLGLAEVNKYLANVKALEGIVRHVVGKGILLIIGAIGSTWTISRVTQAPAQTEHTVVTKSATTVKVEACTAMQPGAERDQCAIKILTELMGQGQR